MRKRVRKKLRLAEFQEFAVALRFRLDPALSQDEVERFADSFLLEAIEGHDLVCGGGCGLKWDLFVTRARRGSVTPEHVATVRAWLERSHSVRDVSVGEPQDAWRNA